MINTTDSTLHVAILLCLALPVVPVEAASVQEKEIFGAAMPHQMFSGGAPVQVHRVRLDGYRGGKAGNAAMLAKLKAEVASCAANLAGNGGSVKPVEEWPDYFMSHRDDYYYAANRSIHYARGATYFVSIKDCSLISVAEHRAELYSAFGACQVDLVKEVAKGNCPADGFASAPVGPKPASDSVRVPAAFAAMAPVKTADHKTILGIHCNVWELPAMLGGGTYCTSNGGAFIPSITAGNRQYNGLLLNLDEHNGRNMQAVDAKLDATVGAAVFAPYMSGAYTFKGDAN
jgi:hypothetical protein